SSVMQPTRLSFELTAARRSNFGRLGAAESDDRAGIPAMPGIDSVLDGVSAGEYVASAGPSLAASTSAGVMPLSSVARGAGAVGPACMRAELVEPFTSSTASRPFSMRDIA